MDDERAPDHTEDPRKQGVGQSGYPESNPESSVPEDAEGDHDEDHNGDPAAAEADRGQSTGNPYAAG